MPRKSRLKAKASSSSSSSTQWEALEDPQLSRRLRVDDSTKKKWDGIQPQASIRTRMAIVIDESLTTSDALEIGATLLDEFDPSEIDLESKLDASSFTPSTDRVPGVSDELLDHYKKSLQASRTVPASFAAMMKALCISEQQQQQRQQQPHIDVEPECMLPLAWFVDAMAQLPFIETIKEMYYDAALALAVNTAKEMAGEVWRHVAAVHAARKQDLADYLWHARQLNRDEATGRSTKRVKREDV